MDSLLEGGEDWLEPLSELREELKKTQEKDCCNHIQVGFEEISERKVNKPIKGHFKAQAPTRILREFEVENINEVEIGQVFDVNLFAEGESVAVSGNSKGKGFTGVMKRHGFHGQPASHGHRGHRGTGSIGQCATPARVFKGKKMHGRHGNSKVTQLGLKIVKIHETQHQKCPQAHPDIC